MIYLPVERVHATENLESGQDWVESKARVSKFRTFFRLQTEILCDALSIHFPFHKRLQGLIAFSPN